MQTQKKALMRTRKRKIMNKEEKITLLTENGESLRSEERRVGKEC